MRSVQGGRARAATATPGARAAPSAPFPRQGVGDACAVLENVGAEDKAIPVEPQAAYLVAADPGGVQCALHVMDNGRAIGCDVIRTEVGDVSKVGAPDLR